MFKGLFPKTRFRWYQFQIVIKYLIGTKYHIICMARRGGKDFTTFALAILQCLVKPGSRVKYLFPYSYQALEVIRDGTLLDGSPWLSALIWDRWVYKTRNGGYVHWDSTIRFKNGSLISLAGANNAEAKLGSNIDLLVISECATIPSEAWEYMIPNVMKVQGRIILVSTPRLGSLFNQMLCDSELSNIWSKVKLPAHTLREVDGSRVYSDKLLKEIQGIMSEAKFAQEYGCDTDSYNDASIYGRSLKNKIMIKDVGPSVGELYVSLDLGSADSTDLSFFTILYGRAVLIHWYQATQQPTGHFIRYIREFCSKLGMTEPTTVILPHDSGTNHDGIQFMTSRYTAYRQAFRNVVKLSPFPVQQAIEHTRNMIEKRKVGFLDVPLIREKYLIQIASYEYRVTPEGVNTFVPVHGKGNAASNTCDSLEYFLLWYFKKEYKRNFGLDLSSNRSSYLKKQPKDIFDMKLLSPRSAFNPEQFLKNGKL